MNSIHQTAIIDPSVQLPENIEVGPFSVIHPGVILNEGVQIGSHCLIGKNVLSYEAVIGSRTKIMTNSNIGGGFEIGSDCFIGLHVVMFNDRHPNEKKTSRTELGRAIIGNKVMIGSNSTILPNLEIHDHVVIGAGSIITKSINEPGTYLTKKEIVKR